MLFGMKRVECEKAMRKRLQMQPPPPFPMYFEYRWLVAHGHINFNSKLKYYLNVQCCRQAKTFVQMFGSVVKIRHYLDIWMFSSVMNIRHYFRCLVLLLLKALFKCLVLLSNKALFRCLILFGCSEIQRVPLEQLMLRIRMLDIFSSSDARVGITSCLLPQAHAADFVLYLTLY